MATAAEVLVGVRVPKKFHERIQRECRRREISLKDMVTDALKMYFESPVDWEYKTTTYFSEGDGEESAGAAEESTRAAAEESAWEFTWLKFKDKVPREKIEVIVKAMEWDLETLRKSKRHRKVPRRRQAGSHP
jgi:hypothetical protein